MLPADLKGRIDAMVRGDKVVLFMKGTRAAPRCGFSASVVELLNDLIPEYTTVDVLADPALREGIKEYSDWPTIPQLYIGGEFVGGADITAEMAASGELATKLGVQAPAPQTSVDVALTDAAARALLRAKQGEDESHDHLRLSVNARFQHQLSFGPRIDGDVVVESNGIKIAVDRASVKRAQGVRIDFVDGPQGQGFKIDNPNEPPKVKRMSVKELKQRLDAKDGLVLFDVRPEDEQALAKIAGSKTFHEAALDGLSKDTPLAFVCHTGRRSMHAAMHVLQHGFKNVSNVEGGVDAWANEIDASIGRY